MGYGMGDFLVLLLVLKAPTEEAFFFFPDGVAIGLDTSAMLGGEAVELLLDLAILFGLLLLQVFHRFLLHALKCIESAVAADGILNDVLQLDAGGVQGEENGAAFDVRVAAAEVIALQHVCYPLKFVG